MALLGLSPEKLREAAAGAHAPPAPPAPPVPPAPPAMEDDPVPYDIPEFLRGYLEREGDPIGLSLVRSRILQALALVGRATRSELREYTRHRPSSIKLALDTLLADGLMLPGPHVVEITAKGLKYAEQYSEWRKQCVNLCRV